MRYPCLVPQRLCKTPISIQIDQEGLNEYGEPFSTVTYSGICKKLPVISGGEATVFGMKRRIVEARKARNPDGTVNYTEVWLE